MKEIVLDSRRRANLGSCVRPGDKFFFVESDDGTITLTPAVVVPKNDPGGYLMRTMNAELAGRGGPGVTYDAEWLSKTYPVDFDTGVDEAADDIALGEAIEKETADMKSRQRWGTGMIRNAAYWAGYAAAMEVSE